MLTLAVEEVQPWSVSAPAGTMQDWNITTQPESRRRNNIAIIETRRTSCFSVTNHDDRLFLNSSVVIWIPPKYSTGSEKEVLATAGRIRYYFWVNLLDEISPVNHKKPRWEPGARSSTAWITPSPKSSLICKSGWGLRPCSSPDSSWLTARSIN